MRRRGVGWLLAFAGCASSSVEPSPSTEAEDEARDFRPIRQMVDDGRTAASPVRRCRSDGLREQPRTPEDLVVGAWPATSELIEFIVAAVPELLDRAEAQPDQRGQRPRYVVAAELDLPGTRLGGVIKIKHRPSPRPTVLEREKLITSDLWMRDIVSGRVVIFDGRIDYGSLDAEGRPDTEARVRGWAEVDGGYPAAKPMAFGAEVELAIETHDAGRAQVDGTIAPACGGTMRIEADLHLEPPCALTPASMVRSVRIERDGASIRLTQDDALCDGCVWLTGSNDARIERSCVEGWWPQARDPARPAQTSK